MIKKIIFCLLLILSFLSFSSTTFAVLETPLRDKMRTANENVRINNTPENQKNAKEAKDAYESSSEAQWDITSQWFTISVDDISPGMWVQWSTTKQNVNYLLGTIIQNLMIALWSISILIMTVWAWYMLTYYWEDEQLTKWKNLFMWWVYAMVIALSSYYIVSIVRYLLYFGDN